MTTSEIITALVAGIILIMQQWDRMQINKRFREAVTQRHEARVETTSAAKDAKIAAETAVDVAKVAVAEAQTTKEITQATASEVSQTRNEINGRVTELVAATKQAGEQKGKIEERARADAEKA